MKSLEEFNSILADCDFIPEGGVHHAYIQVNEDGNVFYIGRGINGRSLGNHSSNQDWMDELNRNDEIRVIRVITNLSYEQSEFIEAVLIHKMGIDNLTNQMNTNLPVVGLLGDVVLGPFRNMSRAGEYLIESGMSSTKMENVRSTGTRLAEVIASGKKYLGATWKHKIDK